MAPKDVVHEYYSHLAQKNDKWANYFADDITFSDAGMNMNEAGKEAVTISFNQFLKSVESLIVKLMITEENRVCVIVGYEYINSHGEKMSQDVSEVWTVRDGKLSTLVIYFDFTEFRNFVRR